MFDEGESFVRVASEMTSIATSNKLGVMGVGTLLDIVDYRVMFVLTNKRLLALGIANGGRFAHAGVPLEGGEEIVDHIGDASDIRQGKFILTTRKLLYLVGKEPIRTFTFSFETFTPTDEITTSLTPRKGMLERYVGRHDLVIMRIRDGKSNQIKLLIEQKELPFARKVQEMLLKAVKATVFQ